MTMPDTDKIEAIVSFVTRYPETTASRRICRELFGAGKDKVSPEFSRELFETLRKTDHSVIDSYFCLIR